WLVPELELALSPTSFAAAGGAGPGSVLWFEPRLHLRLELWRGMRVQPFAVIGGGAPVALSAASNRFATSIIGDGYLGGGIRFDTHKGFVLRFDARLAILPAQPTAGFGATGEIDVGFGVEFRVGERARAAPEEVQLAAAAPPPDRDGDGIP